MRENSTVSPQAYVLRVLKTMGMMYCAESLVGRLTKRRIPKSRLLVFLIGSLWITQSGLAFMDLMSGADRSVAYTENFSKLPRSVNASVIAASTGPVQVGCFVATVLFGLYQDMHGRIRPGK